MGGGFSGWPWIGDQCCPPIPRRRPGGRRRRAVERHTDLQPRAAAPGCPHCGGGALSRFGRTPRGAQRWHCRTCGRKHQATTRTALAGLRQPHKFGALVADMLGPEPSSCRKLARDLMLDKSTVWQWRQKASHGFAVTDRRTLIEPIRMGVAVVRESRKASREWVNHRRDPATHAEPDRLRWLDYPRLGLPAPDHLPRYRIPVGIAFDRAGRRAAEVLDRFAAEECPPSRSALPPTSTAPGAYQRATQGTGPATSSDPGARQLATQGAAAVMNLGQLARGPRPTGSRPPSGLDEVWRELGAFGRFLRPFRGPATRHLPAYVAWFVTRQERDGPAVAATPAPT